MGRMILLHTQQEKRKQIEQLCKKLGIQVEQISGRDCNKTIGTLAGMKLPGAKQSGKMAPAAYLLPEILVFSGFAEDALDAFLAGYREAGIEQIPLKAIITPYNFNWSLYELAQELVKERMAVLFQQK